MIMLPVTPEVEDSAAANRNGGAQELRFTPEMTRTANLASPNRNSEHTHTHAHTHTYIYTRKGTESLITGHVVIGSSLHRWRRKAGWKDNAPRPHEHKQGFTVFFNVGVPA